MVPCVHSNAGTGEPRPQIRTPDLLSFGKQQEMGLQVTMTAQALTVPQTQ